MTEMTANEPRAAAKRENFLFNIAFNLILPIIALKYLSGEARLGPTIGLIVALSFPVGYFIYDFERRRNYNIISVLGFLNILLTGGIGLLGAQPIWVVIKETALPLVIGCLVLFTGKSEKSLLKTFLLNDQVFDIDKINSRIDTQEKRQALEKHFSAANWLLAISFVVSAAINCVLASMIVKSQGGTEAYNSEIATLNWVSWLVITVPTMSILVYALVRLVKGLTALTGLSMDEMLHASHQKKA